MHAGLGNYTLLSQFNAAAKSPDELCLITSYPVEEIVARVLNRKDQNYSNTTGIITII